MSTPLCIFTKNSLIKTINISSIKCGANPFLRNKYGKTAKNLASRQSAMFQLLKGYEFLFATSENNISLMTSLLQADETILDFQGKDGYTALLIATELGDVDTISFLLQQGADCSLTCDDGNGITELASDARILSLFFEEDEAEMTSTSSNSWLGFFGISGSTKSNRLPTNEELRSPQDRELNDNQECLSRSRLPHHLIAHVLRHLHLPPATISRALLSGVLYFEA